MAYFNGSIHGFNSSKGYIPPVPTTKIYCDKCAEAAIPLPEETRMNSGRRHWDTDFRWCPIFGDKCMQCEEGC